jgi:hypothetical protein
VVVALKRINRLVVVTNTICSLFCRNWEYGVKSDRQIVTVKNEVGCLKQKGRICILNDP